MRVIASESLPVKLWLDTVDESAFSQVKNLANLPFAFHHIALMPDAHTGFGMPIGGILATRDVVVPNAVGVDIGCGMCAVRTTLQDIHRNTIEAVIRDIRKSIPLGFNHRKKAVPDRMPERTIPRKSVVEREYDSACHQIGTLGGGNHFIEIQKGSDGFVWLMIHSGSRNIGKQVADFYNRCAKALAPKMKWELPRNYDLAYLMADSVEGTGYEEEMSYCLAFAQANRDFMMDVVKEIIAAHSGCSFDRHINIHHNYASKEEHFGKRVIVHRKGATAAYPGQEGIIPGSQGTKSYIVRGKGNPESFMSCSHGAGRTMSRKQACRVLDLSREIKRMDDAGIVHGMRHHRDLDEAASAYKNIDEVMAAQEDLVSVDVVLRPLGVVKG